jgi:hypothetical protein
MSLQTPLRAAGTYLPSAGTFLPSTILLSAALFLLFTAPASAGDGVNVELAVRNDEIAPIYVTIYDGNVNPPNTAVMQHARISGFASVPVSVSPDATGRANISWTASSSATPKCGHGAMNNLTNNASVKVQVDSNCSRLTFLKLEREP